MESAKIQISIKLLEKLAGVKREERRPQRGGPGGGGSGGPGSGGPGSGGGGGAPFIIPGVLPVLHSAGPLGPFAPPDIAAALAAEPDLRGALTLSRRVGGLLLKAEEAETAAIAAAADDLLRRDFSAPKRPTPCQTERDACTDCYQRHKEDAWSCAGLVDAYVACASAAYEQVSAPAAAKATAAAARQRASAQPA